MQMPTLMTDTVGFTENSNQEIPIVLLQAVKRDTEFLLSPFPQGTDEGLVSGWCWFDLITVIREAPTESCRQFVSEG